MFKTENEIWEAVKNLRGKTITTITQSKPNKIIEVEDTSNNFDKIHIAGRQTRPSRQDVVEAYKVLAINGELDRKADLAHLAGVNKQTSAIVFALVYAIAEKDVELVERDRRLIISLKK